jgi:hypothetical protein
MIKTESIKKNQSNTFTWVFALALLLSVFSFSGFVSSASHPSQKRTQTEQQILIRQKTAKTVHYKLPALVAHHFFQVCFHSFAETSYVNVLVAKSENFSAALLLFYQNEAISCVLYLPRASSDIIPISLQG